MIHSKGKTTKYSVADMHCERLSFICSDLLVYFVYALNQWFPTQPFVDPFNWFIKLHRLPQQKCVTKLKQWTPCKCFKDAGITAQTNLYVHVHIDALYVYTITDCITSGHNLSYTLFLNGNGPS